MQRCASCGAENRDVARFCATCGRRLDENVQAPQPATSPAPAPDEAGERRLHAGLDGVLSEDDDRAGRGGSEEPSGQELDLTPDTQSADVRVDEPASVGAGEARDAAGGTSSPAEDTADKTTGGDSNPESVGVLSPLLPGALVAGRWQITQVEESAAGRNTYLALDLAACPSCGATLDPDEDYCSECGAQLAQAGSAPAITLHEAESPDALAGFGPAVFDGGRLYVATAAAPLATVSDDPGTPKSHALTVGYASDRGLVRDLDEDSLFVFTLAGLFESRVGPSVGLFIVADGMGGHEGGELASREAVAKIAGDLIDGVLHPLFKGSYEGSADAVKKDVEQAVIDANTVVHKMAIDKGIDAGTTVTLALVVNGEVHIANVGDSRTYLFRQGKLRQVTQDHSLVASLVQVGALQPEEIYTHPQRSAVYRSLGSGPKVEVDQFYESLQSGDALVLCCDGIWEVLRPEGIEEVLLGVSDARAACDELIRRGNAAGGDDNLSVIVVRIV